VLPSKKSGGGSGLVEMSSRQSAIDAVTIERGFSENPLKLKPLESDGGKTDSPVPNSFSTSSARNNPAGSFDDFETLVMRQLRQQEERKRLIAEMMKQDEEDGK